MVKSVEFGVDIVILFLTTYTGVIPSRCLTDLSLVKAEHVKHWAQGLAHHKPSCHPWGRQRWTAQRGEEVG